MKEQRRVYEALSKIYSEGKEELSSEKVELGAIDDLQSKYAKAASKAVPLKKVIEKAARELMQVSDELDAVKEDAKILQGMARELGADNIVDSAKTLESSAKGLSQEWGKAALKALDGARMV